MLESNTPPPSATSSSSDSRAQTSRLNAQAPAFVPRAASSSVHVYPPPTFRPPPNYYNLHHHYNNNYNNHNIITSSSSSSSNSSYRPRGDDVAVEGGGDDVAAVVLRNGVTEESALKIINQVEYYFSDINLATTDHLMRFISKDAEGYVPLSVVASFKKIKAVIGSNSQLANILRDSAKLVVSDDGKKVRRQHPLTESNLEDLQSRIIVAENLPEDHCHQNLMKIFSAVGSVKTIRTCQPQSLNGGASSASKPVKPDSMFVSNKLHAFVEYESVEVAEKAVAELNDEANWRNGLKVRLFVRNNGKPGQPRGKKLELESEVSVEENGTSSTLLQPQMREKNREDHSQQLDGQTREHIGQGEEHVNDKEGAMKKGRGRGKGKGRGGRGAQSQNHHHHHHYHNNANNNNNNQQHRNGTPPSGSFEHKQPSMISKQPPGPRMPDGTRGFSLGRGKPLQIA